METRQRTPPLYRVIIAGGREFNDYGLLCQTCDRILSQKHQTHDIVIISGAARGADTLGERYAQERGYAIERFPADWESLDVRRKEMKGSPLYIDDTPGLSIYDLKTRARRTAREHGIKLIIIDYLQLMNANGMCF